MNCSFNIRYKPRTTRSFTKSDLTVYDSADNTALNALTVYGKSEVVDGSIKSAGEGWATVDLGAISWGKTDNGRMYTSPITEIKRPADRNTLPNIVNPIYMPDTDYNVGNLTTDKTIAIGNDYRVYVYDTDYTDPAAFKTAMSGVLLCYQLADPTQGNTIAVKTDNGTGINGTMAVFTTGTPLRGIPDSDVRDVMTWDGSAGTVTKVLSDIDLGTLNYTYDTTRQWFQSIDLKQLIKPTPTVLDKGNLLCPIYTAYSINNMWATSVNDAIGVNEGATLYVRNSSYTDPADFKTAMSGVKLVYELATPTTQNLTSTENDSLAGLRTFTPQTHAQNNAGATMTVDYTVKVPTI